MATVSLNIGGKKYDIDCAEGQEDHLRRLSESIDGRVQALRKNFGQASDAMILVVLALMMQDEMGGGKREENTAPVSSSADNTQLDELIEQVLEPSVSRIEALAKRLEML